MLRILLFILIFTRILFPEKTALCRTVADYRDTIALPEVVITARKESREYYERERKRRARLEYNVRKTYPYARIAAQRLQIIEQKMQTMEKKKEKRKFLKAEYKSLMHEFKKPVKNLSISQGKILIKLIYRETDNSTFAHIKEYRGSLNAFFWQSVAVIFGHNLKAAYDPTGEDCEIEEFVNKIETENKSGIEKTIVNLYHIP